MCLSLAVDSCDGGATELSGLVPRIDWEGVGWTVDQGLVESDRWRSEGFRGGGEMWFDHATGDWQLLAACCVTRLGCHSGPCIEAGTWKQLVSASISRRPSPVLISLDS